jgi:site-specific recombinase XerD
MFFRKASGDTVKKNFEGHFKQWISHCKTTKAASTIEKYEKTLEHLKDFCKAKPWCMDFASMTFSFYEAWVKYLIEVKKQSNNTVGTYIKNLKVSLRWAYNSELSDRKDFERFKALSYDTEVVYLTRAELNSIACLDLSTQKSLERIRDVFVFACETGQRFSDIFKIRPGDIRDEVLHVRTKKTEDFLRIPLSPAAKQILAKYPNGIKALPVKQKRYINQMLKTIGELAKITATVTPFKKSGSTTVHLSRPKHEVISTHTARRTFVTLSLESGLRPEVVMGVTGHKDFKTMKKYLKLTDGVIQAELQRMWDKREPIMQAV